MARLKLVKLSERKKNRCIDVSIRYNNVLIDEYDPHHQKVKRHIDTIHLDGIYHEDCRDNAETRSVVVPLLTKNVLHISVKKYGVCIIMEV